MDLNDPAVLFSELGVKIPPLGVRELPQVPCASCIRRNRAAMCPNGTGGIFSTSLNRLILVSQRRACMERRRDAFTAFRHRAVAQEAQ